MGRRNRYLKHAKNLLLIALVIVSFITLASAIQLEQNVRNVLLEFFSFNYLLVFGTVNILPRVFGYKI